MSSSITLAQVAERAAILAVACSRCDRRGLYMLETLIAQHGPDYGIPALLRTLSADCPKRDLVLPCGNCGMRCPELPALFKLGGPARR